jgi:two-component system, chemotaxis family, sensor kinase CheA
MIEDEELRNLYQISSEERLQQLEAGLRHLTLHPDDEMTLKELRREAHGLRGDSRGVGAEAVETLAHCFEKILGRIKRQQLVLTPLLSDRLYQGLAAISLLVQEAVTEQPSGVDLAEVLELLMPEGWESQQPQQDASGNWAGSTLVDDDGETDTDEDAENSHSPFQPTFDDRIFLDAEVEQRVELASSAFVNNGYRVTVPAALADINDNALEFASSFTEDETLRELYHITSLERLQNLEAGLRQLILHPDNETTLDELYREAHSLTGDSRTAGVETVEILSHSLEEILLSIKRQQIVLTQQVSERLAQGLADIHCLVQEAVTGQPSGVDVAEAIDRWMEVVLESQLLQGAVSDTQSEVDFAPQSFAGWDGVPSPNFPIFQSSSPPVSHSLQLAPTLIEDEVLREIYKTTSEERLQKLEAGLLHLEKYPNDETTLNELLREAHSLKGDSRSADLEQVETLTHVVEDILLGIQRQHIILTSEVSDRLYRGLDAIALLVKEAVTGQRIEVDTAGVLEQLKAVVAAPRRPESLPVSPEKVQSKPVRVREDKEDKDEKESFSSPGANEPYRIDTIRVPTRELDDLMTQAEELTVTKIHIAHAMSEMEELADLWDKWKAFDKKQRRRSPSVAANPYQASIEKAIDTLSSLVRENSTKLDFIAGELREKIRTLRLLPLSTLFQIFPRIVRDLARQQAKEVELIIEGGETTADKRILEELKDSLIHMIRNCVDHGIETPAERAKLGKPPVATIWLRGYRTAHNIIIEVADDGRGLDIEKIKQTAIKRKLYQPEELEAMATSQIYSLIFAPGFSTRTFITEISGRGIGLDVVHTNVERLKGTIQTESTPGQGCTFRLQLRSSLATLNALLVQVRGIVHALPMEYVPASLLVSPDEITTIDGRATITWDDQNIPIADLAELLQLSNSPAYASIVKIEQPPSDFRSCILLKVGEEQVGFFVDRLLETQEIVIKTQSQLLKRVRNVAGATILPSGEVCMILNPPDLLKSVQQQTPSAISIQPIKTIQRKPTILLVEDSIYVRTQEQRLLEKAGYEVVTAVDGLDGYHQLKTRDFDAVISDVEMPNLDGLSLTAKIRQHQEYKDLPIILVTTLNTDEDKKRGAEAGASAYVIKGKFNQGVLLETLERLV